jgi:hypothetical protein
MKALIRLAACKPAVTKRVGSWRVEHYHQRLPIHYQGCKAGNPAADGILGKIACVETVSCLPVKQKFEGRNLAGEPILSSIWQRMYNLRRLAKLACLSVLKTVMTLAVVGVRPSQPPPFKLAPNEKCKIQNDKYSPSYSSIAEHPVDNRKTQERYLVGRPFPKKHDRESMAT